MKLVVCSDGSLATKNDGSSQIWYLIFIANKNIKASINDYESNKSRRVGRSVIGAEMFNSKHMRIINSNIAWFETDNWKYPRSTSSNRQWKAVRRHNMERFYYGEATYGRCKSGKGSL